MPHQTPEESRLESRLEQFAKRVGIIVALEHHRGGNLTPELAYSQIKQLWKSLKKEKKALFPKAKMEGEAESNEDPKPNLS